MRATIFRPASVAVVGLLVACLAAGRPAAAAEGGQLGAAPWFPLVEAPGTAEETYQLNTLDIVRVGDDGWRANRGKYRSLVSRHDFYVTVGRTDLARHEATSAATSRVLLWSGIAAVAVGALLLYAHVSPGGADPGLDPGLIAGGAGLAAVYVSTFFTGPSVSQDEAAEMTQRYNAELRRRIQDELPPPAPRPIQARAPRMVPWTDGRSGGGLMAVASF